MAVSLKRTPLYQEHLSLGARMVPFAGWEMPLQYTGIIEEHHAVRREAGLFDISHMARIFVAGPAAFDLLQRTVTRDLSRVEIGQSTYALACNEEGGILDDLYVYHSGPQEYVVIGNAANRDRDFAWLAAQKRPGEPVEVTDRSDELGMLAFQGPKAPALLQSIVETDILGIPRHGCGYVNILGHRCFIGRTGYTGEDGFEVLVPADGAVPLWRRILDLGVRPCGLGARDTLRLEAALMLYGNDIDTTTNPYEAGLGWVVNLDKGPFIGREALMAIKERGVSRRLVCFEMLERGDIARPGYPIYHEGQEVGRVTSGGPSPTLGKNIGMGYVPTELAAVGARLDIKIRDRFGPARVVRRPFYRSPSLGG